jgi:hypothetical protein
MKRTITTLVSLLIFITVSYAQHFNIGIKGGLNAYTITNDNVFENDLKTGLHLGLIGHAHLSGQIALQPEILYSAQGSRYTMSGNKVNLNLNYINVPLIFQYMYDNGFRLQAGPQLGVLVSAKSKSNNSEYDVKDDFETIDLGIGVGVSYVNPATDFGVDVRYNHGLTNISKNDNSALYNRGFQLGVFYLFNHN